MHGKTIVRLAILLIITGTGVAKAFHNAERGDAGTATELRSKMPAADDPLALGKQVYETLCIACHTMESPPTLAPPMTHVARHIRQAFTDSDSAVAHIVEFVRNPSEERSKMPARVRERYGLMAPLNLPEAQLRAVAAYIWSLPDPAPH